MSDVNTPRDTPVRRRRRSIGILLMLAYAMLWIFGGCADSLLLYPTTGHIDASGAERIELTPGDRQPLEVYSRRLNVASTQEPEAFVLLLDGNGGRAETAISWAEAMARDHAIEAWALNYPGYGRSPGKAKLSSIGPSALAAYDALKQRAGNRPVVIWGASMGSTAALHIAANRPVAGLVLTNPPPLRQLIVGRYGWWNLWLLALPVSVGVPSDLDSVTNASKVTIPAVIVTAQNDFTVPPDYQQKVINAYAGPKHLVSLPNAGHNTPATVANPDGWYGGIDWLWQQVGLRGPKSPQTAP